MPANRPRLTVSPHSVEAEQALLGGLMLDSKAWARIRAGVVASDFYRPDHRIIFEAISNLSDKCEAVDAVTVSNFLERNGMTGQTGGLAYLGALAKDTPTAANIETYAAAVRERSVLRGLQRIGEDIVKASSTPTEQTATELIASIQEDLHRLQSRARVGSGLIAARQLVGELINDLDHRFERIVGLQLGLPDFDELTCGLEAGDLVVIAARPSMGKTALLVSVASTVSESTGVAVFSAEMPALQLMRRCVALKAEIPQGLLRRTKGLPDEHWKKIDKATVEIAQKRLWIDEAPLPTVAHIRSETLALKAREDLGLVLVDYVQLVRGEGRNRYEELRDVAYAFKALSKELGVPIVLLAQLNRGVESREEKRAQVSDIRDSGGIEEAADVVGMLYSESYYDSDFSMPYVIECEIVKNRNGSRGSCLWRFDGALSRVTPLDPAAAIEYRRVLTKRNRRKENNL